MRGGRVRVIVTRPAREAVRWMDALGQRGLEALALSLIVIEPVPDSRALQQAWHELAQFTAVMFVSANAVDQFFMQKPAAAGVSWALHAIKTRAWAPGPGTGDALAAAGVDRRLIDAPPIDAPRFDSEALWQQVRAQVAANQRVLIVRGADSTGQGAGREWLAAQLAAAGVRVDTVVAYLRHLPVFDERQRAQAVQAGGDGSIWLFSSSEAVANLVRLLPGQSWAGARAVTTHPRIAQAAQQAGFGVVCESRPAVAAIVAAIESIQ